MDIEALKGWVGRTQTAQGIADTWPVHGLLAALDREERPGLGEDAPYLAHWCYFGPTVPQSRIAKDGHPEKGDFLPPVPLPRRMWAASDIDFHRPIRLGETLYKTARIADVSLKEGKSGALVFVKVANAYTGEGDDPILEETQTLVYRDQPTPDEAPPRGMSAPDNAAWSDHVQPDETRLFRYSAVTFNAHRIHYDRTYTRDVEHYSDILVHGQLTATLLLNSFERVNPGGRVLSFSFRGVQPIFCNEAIYLEGAPDTRSGNYSLWARDKNHVLRTKSYITAEYKGHYHI